MTQQAHIFFKPVKADQNDPFARFFDPIQDSPKPQQADGGPVDALTQHFAYYEA